METIMHKIKPFIAIAVLILIIFSVRGLYNYNNLQKEVKESCGYQASEKVYCVCEKDIISKINIQGNPYYNESLNFYVKKEDS